MNPANLAGFYLFIFFTIFFWLLPVLITIGMGRAFRYKSSKLLRRAVGFSLQSLTYIPAKVLILI